MTSIRTLSRGATDDAYDDRHQGPHCSEDRMNGFRFQVSGKKVQGSRESDPKHATLLGLGVRCQVSGWEREAILKKQSIVASSDGGIVKP